MAIVRGTVLTLTVGTNLTLVSLRPEGGGMDEVFILWQFRVGEPRVLPAFETVVRSAQLTLLREAAVRGWTVQLHTESAVSAKIGLVKAPAP